MLLIILIGLFVGISLAICFLKLFLKPNSKDLPYVYVDVETFDNLHKNCNGHAEIINGVSTMIPCKGRDCEDWWYKGKPIKPIL